MEYYAYKYPNVRDVEDIMLEVSCSLNCLDAGMIPQMFPVGEHTLPEHSIEEVKLATEYLRERDEFRNIVLGIEEDGRLAWGVR